MSLHNPARVRGTGKETVAEYIISIITERGPCTRNYLHKALPVKFHTVDAALQLLQERGFLSVSERLTQVGRERVNVRHFHLTPRAPVSTKRLVITPKEDLKEGDQDWNTPCQNCGQLPTVHATELCGPCCFGEAATAGGNW